MNSVKQEFSASGSQNSKFQDEIQHKKNLLQRIKSGQKGLSSFEQDLQNRHKRNVQTIEYSKQNSNMVQNCASNSNFNMSSPGGGNGQTQSFQQNPNPMLAFAQKNSSRESLAQPNGPSTNQTQLRSTNSQQALMNTRFDNQIESCRDQKSGDVQSQQIGFTGANQLNTVSEDNRPQEVAENFNQYHRSRDGSQQNQAQQHFEQAEQTLRSAVATEEEDRIRRRVYSNVASSADSNIKVQTSLSPPRQNFIVQNASSLGSSNGRGQQFYHRGADSLERQAAQSFPLRKPSVSPSVNFSQQSRSPAITGRDLGQEQTIAQSQNAGFLRRESLKQSRHSSSSHSPRISSRKPSNQGSRQQLQENIGVQNFQQKHPSPIYPIVEQDTTQEISSIDPHGISAQQKVFQNGDYVAVTNDDTQYLLTSVQNSQSLIDPQKTDEKFQFNTNALAESPEKMANKYASHFNQNNNPYQIEAGELSEPMLATGSEKFSRKFSANKDMLDLVKGSTMDYQDQIQTLVRNGDYSGLPTPSETTQKHHAGGSFGNLKEFSQYVGPNNSTNTLANIQKMLEPRSRRVDGEYSTAQTQQTHNFGTNQQQNGHNGFDRKDSGQAKGKVRIMVSDGHEDQTGFDSSLEFKTRKYQIMRNLSSEYTKMKDKGRKGSKRSFKQYQHSSGESEPVNQKALKRQNRRKSASGSKDRRKKSSKQKRQGMRSRNRDFSESLTSSEMDHNDSQISISQKSRDSYGKYFMRSRSNKERRQRSQKQSSRKVRSKSRKGERSARSILQTSSHKKDRLTREKRSKSVAEGRHTKSRSRSRAKNSSRSQTRNSMYVTGSNPAIKKVIVVTSNQSRALRPPINRNHMNTLQHFDHMNTIDSIAKRRNSACRTLQAGVSSLPRARKIVGSKTLRPQTPNVGKSKTSNSVILDSKTGETLAQRLLIDLAKKYRSMGEKQAKGIHSHISGHPVAAKAQQVQIQQMIQEIQSLAIALIKSEKRISKTKTEKTQAVKKLKSIIDDQEECIALLQEKAAKLGSKNDKLQRNEVQLSHDLQRQEQTIGYELAEREGSIQELTQKLQDRKQREEREKREIIIAMEKDLQAQVQQIQVEASLKINSLKSINDQLNVKLQELSEVEKAHKILTEEYQQSLQFLNEFEEQVRTLHENNKQLNAKNQSLEQEVDHLNVMSKGKQDEYNMKIQQMQTRFEQKISSLKKQHKCELQKSLIQHGATEDSSIFRFEEEITDLKMKLKKKDQIQEESQLQLDAIKSEIQNQKTQRIQSEEKVYQKLKDNEEQRERIELEAKNLESQVHHLQRVIQQKDQEIGIISEKNQAQFIDTSEEMSSAMEKENLIRQLQQQLEKSELNCQNTKNKLQKAETQQQNQKKENDQHAQSLQAKIDLQQQEIQILAQGFQAQQVKINSQQKVVKSGHFGGGFSAESNIKIEDVQNTSALSSLSDSGNYNQSKEQRFGNQQMVPTNAIHIQSNCTPRENRTSHSSNTFKKPSQRSGYSQQQTENGVYGSEGQENENDKSYHDIQEETSPETSFRDEEQDQEAVYRDNLCQKDEEIKILLNVIAQMRGEQYQNTEEPMTLGQSLQSLGQVSDKFAKNALLLEKEFQFQLRPRDLTTITDSQASKGNVLTLSHGNQSSIMHIFAPQQHLIGDTLVSTNQMQSDFNSGLNGTRGENLKLSSGQQHLSEPALVDKDQEIRMSHDTTRSVTSKQELIDVKARIQKLMGPKLDANSQQNEQEQKVTDYKSSHRPQGSYGDASSARISKFASGGVLSEGIEEYSLNKQV